MSLAAAAGFLPTAAAVALQGRLLSSSRKELVCGFRHDGHGHGGEDSSALAGGLEKMELKLFLPIVPITRKDRTDRITSNGRAEEDELE
jgi:hypothetical protein